MDHKSQKIKIVKKNRVWQVYINDHEIKNIIALKLVASVEGLSNDINLTISICENAGVLDFIAE